MREEELKVRIWYKKFGKTQSNDLFCKIWDQVKNMVPISVTTFTEFPKDHWDSVKMLAVFEGLQEFNGQHKVTVQKAIEIPTGRKIQKQKRILLSDGTTKIIEYPEPAKTDLRIIEIQRESSMTLLSFLRFKMEVAIKQEKRRIIQTKKGIKSLDQAYEMEESNKADLIFFNEMEDKTKLMPQNCETSEEIYQRLRLAIEQKLISSGETRILRCFRLKLKNPSITNRKISQILGVSKTYTSSYFRKLQKIMNQVIEETETTYV